MFIIHHDRLVASVPEECSEGGGRSAGSAQGSPRPNHDLVPGRGGGPGGVPHAGGDARARLRRGPDDLEALSLLETGRALPSESAIRRVLQRADADDLDARVLSWMRTGTIEGRRAIAVDGKTMRGARGSSASDRAPHLLAALEQASGIVVGQWRASDKSNEIPALVDLLTPWAWTEP